MVILNQRLREIVETTIANSDVHYIYNYVMNFVGGRWPQIETRELVEKKLKENDFFWCNYKHFFIDKNEELRYNRPKFGGEK